MGPGLGWTAGAQLPTSWVTQRAELSWSEMTREKTKQGKESPCSAPSRATRKPRVVAMVTVPLVQFRHQAQGREHPPPPPPDTAWWALPWLECQFLR